MKRAFSLLELMVVVAIMAAMATFSINGYRALVRGMEDRSALVAVQTLVDAAKQRAEVDRKPMIVYFYDELLQRDDESKGDDLVGRGVAIAIRPVSRITAIDGQYLCDEFGDLDQIYTQENQQDSDAGANQRDDTGMRIYRMADGNYADVSPSVFSRPVSAGYILTGGNTGEESNGSGESGEKQIVCYAFKKIGGNAGFQVGDVYGSEFAAVVLPNGYYFGSSAPTQVGRVRVGEPMKIDEEGQGDRNVSVYSMKSGSQSLQKVGTTVKGNN